MADTNKGRWWKPIIWSATPTPFLDGGALDRRSVRKLVEHHVGMSVSGLFLGGTCGEGGFMPDRQRVELVRIARKAAGDSVHIAAHVSDTSPARVSENIRRMVDAGADSVVIALPYVVGGFCNRDFCRRYFLEPLEASQAPVGIYVKRPASGMMIDLPLWDEVVSHPQVEFVKDSSSLPTYRAHFTKIKRMKPNLRLLTGDEFNVVRAVLGGYDGCLLGTGILNARLIGLSLAATGAGDTAAALRWQRRSNRFLRDLFRRDISAWMSGLKYALRRIGLFETEFAHLVFPLDDADRRRIDAALAREREFLAG